MMAKLVRCRTRMTKRTEVVGGEEATNELSLELPSSCSRSLLPSRVQRSREKVVNVALFYLLRPLSRTIRSVSSTELSLPYCLSLSLLRNRQAAAVVQDVERICER